MPLAVIKRLNMPRRDKQGRITEPSFFCSECRTHYKEDVLKEYKPAFFTPLRHVCRWCFSELTSYNGTKATDGKPGSTASRTTQAKAA